MASISTKTKNSVAAQIGRQWAKSHLCVVLITERPNRYASTSSVQSTSLRWVGGIGLFSQLLIKVLCATDPWEGPQKTDINNIIHVDSNYTERVQARQEIICQYPGALDCLYSGVGMLNELYEFLMQEYLPHHYPTMS